MAKDSAILDQLVAIYPLDGNTIEKDSLAYEADGCAILPYTISYEHIHTFARKSGGRKRRPEYEPRLPGTFRDGRRELATCNGTPPASRCALAPSVHRSAMSPG